MGYRGYLHIADLYQLVPYDTVHLNHNLSPFVTWGSLIFDIAIASYIITPFLFLPLYVLFYRGFYIQGNTVCPEPATHWPITT